MNPDVSFADAYANTVRVFGAVLESGPPGMIISIDFGGSFFDRMAWNAATSFNCEFESFPSLMRHRSLLWDRKRPFTPAEIAREPILFGRCDGWLRIFDGAGLSKNYSTDASEVSVRSIDTWSPGRLPLRLIHFGDVTLACDQLSGAEATIDRDRPIVTLYDPAPAGRAQLLSMFDSWHYDVLDLRGTPVPQEQAADLGGLGWIALPREKSRTLPTIGAARSDELRQRPLVEELDAFDVPQRHRRSGEVFGLGRVAPPALSRRIQVSEIACVNDCYPSETNGKSSWRWLGPLPRSRLALPCAFPGIYRFEVAVIGCRMQDGINSCRVLVDGREVLATPNGEEHGTLTFVGRLDAAGYAGYVDVDFLTRGTVLAAGSDPRTLRLNLGTIDIAPWH